MAGVHPVEVSDREAEVLAAVGAHLSNARGITLLVAAPRMARRPRYRVGQP